ncbi:hypothetical protein SAMN06265361_103172 [Laceyella tengchongensis]|uniref:Fe/B12 periplasmic-binding domain-containing protein n=1 Tax=Laceyella tengchongensis TaxID=574699 RepID=A0AA45WNW2_9BACL|nr:hypothetical protein SAMN06265361_103172 [Laceyella tengchongensis]
MGREEVVHRNSDVIVIIDYGEKSAAQKQELLLSEKELEDLPALKNKRFIVMPLSAAAEGVRAQLALKILAKGMYPGRIKMRLNGMLVKNREYWYYKPNLNPNKFVKQTTKLPKTTRKYNT